MLLLTTVPVLTLTWIAVQNTKASVKTQIIDANVTRVRWAVQYLEEVLLRFDDLFYSLQINDSFVRIKEDFEKRTDGATRNAQLELRRLLTASYYSYSALVDQLSYYSQISGQTTKIDNKFSGDISYPKTEGPLWKGVFEYPIPLSLRLADGRVYALHTVNRFMDQRLQGVFYARVDESLSEKILGHL